MLNKSRRTIPTRPILLTIVACFAVCLIYGFYTSFHAFDKTDRAPAKDYIDLFSDESKKELIAGNSYKSHNKNDISEFKYKNMFITIYKININSSESIEKTVELRKTADTLHESFVFVQTSQPICQLQFRSTLPSIASPKIIVYLNASDMKFITGTYNEMAYTMTAESIALKHSASNENDIEIEKRGDKNFNCSIHFIKRGPFVYFIFATSNQNSSPIDDTDLYNILKR